METVNTSIRIHKDTLDKLRTKAQEQDRSLNYIINELIRVGLQDQK